MKVHVLYYEIQDNKLAYLSLLELIKKIMTKTLRV